MDGKRYSLPSGPSDHVHVVSRCLKDILHRTELLTLVRQHFQANQIGNEILIRIQFHRLIAGDQNILITERL